MESDVSGSEALTRLLVTFGQGALDVTRFQVSCAGFRLEYYQKQLAEAKAGGDDNVKTNEILERRQQAFIRSSQELAIVYATAIFDSFLNSITRFVFYSLPNKVLKNETVQTSQLLARSSTEILERALKKRSDAVARESFLQRFRILESVLGIKFNHSDEDLSVLREVIQLRNTIVHDVNSISMHFGKSGEIVLGAQTVINESDYSIDTDVFDRLVPGIYRAVVGAIQDRKLTELEEGWCELFARQRRGVIDKADVTEVADVADS